MSLNSVIHDFLDNENYRVSSGGQVFSRYSRQGHLTNQWRELKPRYKHGYPHIVYKRHQLAIHRIVVTCFIGPIPPKFQVNHKDGNPSNCCLTNLEIVSQSENILHRIHVLNRSRTFVR